MLYAGIKEMLCTTVCQQPRLLRWNEKILMSTKISKAVSGRKRKFRRVKLAIYIIHLKYSHKERHKFYQIFEEVIPTPLKTFHKTKKWIFSDPAEKLILCLTKAEMSKEIQG